MSDGRTCRPSVLTQAMMPSLMSQVGAVIVGFDRRINYHKIQTATLCIRENPGCHFIATNLDAVTHLTDAQEWAGNGAMVGAIKGERQGYLVPPELTQCLQTCYIQRVNVGPCACMPVCPLSVALLKSGIDESRLGMTIGPSSVCGTRKHCIVRSACSALLRQC